MENSLNYLCEYIRRMGNGTEKVGLIKHLTDFVGLIFQSGTGLRVFTEKVLMRKIKDYLNTPPEHSAAASDVGTVPAEGGGGANPLHKE